MFLVSYENRTTAPSGQSWEAIGLAASGVENAFGQSLPEARFYWHSLTMGVVLDTLGRFRVNAERALLISSCDEHLSQKALSVTLRHPFSLGWNLTEET